MVSTSRTRYQAAWQWARSPSTCFGLVIGALMYGSYGIVHNALTNPVLVATALFFGLMLPQLAKVSNGLDLRVRTATRSIALGRIARFSVQLLLNLSGFAALAAGGVLGQHAASALGGILGTALLTTLASLGAQEVGIRLAQSGYGEPVHNVQFGLSANSIATAAATAGATTFAAVYTVTATVLGALGLGAALVADWRSRKPGRGAVIRG